MKTPVGSRNIEKGLRKRLLVEAKRGRRMRAVVFAAVVIPIWVSGPLAGSAAGANPSLERSGAGIGAALILSAIIWEAFGRRRLRAEVERMKNA